MAKAKRPRGRPTRYTHKVANEILRRLASGETLRGICGDPGMPPASTVRGWVVDDRHGFAERYARARMLQADSLADETIEIADDLTEDAQSRRVRVDTRKWLIGKIHPAQYGDRAQVEHSGPGGGAIPTELTVRFVRPKKSDGDGSS